MQQYDPSYCYGPPMHQATLPLHHLQPPKLEIQSCKAYHDHRLPSACGCQSELSWPGKSSLSLDHERRSPCHHGCAWFRIQNLSLSDENFQSNLCLYCPNTLPSRWIFVHLVKYKLFCLLTRHDLGGSPTASKTELTLSSFYRPITAQTKRLTQWAESGYKLVIDAHLILIPCSLNNRADIFLLFVSNSLWDWRRALLRTLSSALAIQKKRKMYWDKGPRDESQLTKHLQIASCWFFPWVLRLWDIDVLATQMFKLKHL